MLFKGKLLVSIASIGVVGGVGVGTYHYRIKNIDDQESEMLAAKKEVPNVLPEVAPQIAPRIEIPLSQPEKVVSEIASSPVVIPDAAVVPHTVVDTKVIDTTLNTSKNSEDNSSGKLDENDKADQEDSAEGLVEDSGKALSAPEDSDSSPKSNPVASDKKEKESIAWTPLVPATISSDSSLGDKSDEI